MITLGVTGHRPEKLGGYKIPNSTYLHIVSESRRFIQELKPQQIITGMCIGYDQWIAEIAIELNIPFVAAVPFVGQELFWPKTSQERYKELLAHAEDIVVVNNGGFANWKMQTRNEWIVRKSNILLAAFNGDRGGTYNCVEYAKKHSKSIIIIEPLKESK